MKRALNILRKWKILLTAIVSCFSMVACQSPQFPSPFSKCDAALIAKLQRVEELMDNKLGNIDPLFRRQFMHEVRDIAMTSNPSINSNINYILVLSGRASYLKNPIDHPNIPDKNDDYNRMQLGIKLAREITAMRLAKQDKQLSEEDLIKFGPTIIYNGRPAHNIELKKALATNIITDYPISKFLVLELPQDQINTKGQFISVQQNIDLSNEKLAIVTSAFHFPRVGRTFGGEKPFNFLGTNVTVYAYLHDRSFMAPGVEQELIDEAAKISRYIAQGNLKPSLDDSIIYQGQRCLTQ
jgi:hypothetical protein